MFYNATDKPLAVCPYCAVTVAVLPTGKIAAHESSKPGERWCRGSTVFPDPKDVLPPQKGGRP